MIAEVETQVEKKWELRDHDIMVMRAAYTWGPSLVAVAKQIKEGWHPSRTLGPTTDVRTSSTLRLSDRIPVLDADNKPILGPDGQPTKVYVYPQLEAFDKGFSDVMREVIQNYDQVNSYAIRGHEVVVNDKGYDLLRYTVEQRYGLHVDTSPRSKPSMASHGRVLSVVSWPVGGFEGGELWFPRQKVKITPEPGMVVVFPSGYTHPHEALPVLSGEKYSIVTWLI